MKIIYCNRSLHRPGGMERVMMNKIDWFIKNKGWEVVIITTDQKKRPSFHTVPQGVRHIDLGINYGDLNDVHFPRNAFLYHKKKALHKMRLTKVLMREKADVVVSLFPNEVSFLPDIKDGSKKVLELHYCHEYRMAESSSRTGALWARFKTRSDEKIARRFDKFVVLTKEDAGYWSKMPNLTVIPNAAVRVNAPTEHGCVDGMRRVLAVGRLDFQKGFDRLIEAWTLVQWNEQYEDWCLDIYGRGPWRKMLETLIQDRGLSDTVCIHDPVKNIGAEYTNSEMLVMTSHYEGFPMVMIEAMAHGLPVVTFDFKCGPQEIVKPGVNGVIVEDGHIAQLAEEMMELMRNDEKRMAMGMEARKVAQEYSVEKVMGMWVDLFEGLCKK